MSNRDVNKMRRFMKKCDIIVVRRGGASSCPCLSREQGLGTVSVLGSVPAALINPRDRALARGPAPVHVTPPRPLVSCLLA